MGTFTALIAAKNVLMEVFHAHIKFNGIIALKSITTVQVLALAVLGFRWLRV